MFFRFKFFIGGKDNAKFVSRYQEADFFDAINPIYGPIECVCWRIVWHVLPLHQKKKITPLRLKHHDNDKFDERWIPEKNS